jgi:hypothetical protein
VIGIEIGEIMTVADLNDMEARVDIGEPPHRISGG